MLGGDISNERVPRVLVTYDYVTDEVARPKKVLGFVVGVQAEREFNRDRLAGLLLLSDRAKVQMELVVFGASDEQARSILDELDQRGWQPFNHATGYPTAYELVSDLPYRPEVLGVIDIPERAAGYGSYATNTDYLARAI